MNLPEDKQEPKVLISKDQRPTAMPLQPHFQARGLPSLQAYAYAARSNPLRKYLERLHMNESPLSQGERTVILRAMLGEETDATAEALHVSPHTVKKRKQSIMRKHDAPNMLRASILELYLTGYLATLPEMLLRDLDLLHEVCYDKDKKGTI